MQEVQTKKLLDKISVRTQTTHELTDYVTHKKTAAAALSPQYADLWGSIENLVHAGGKRLRAYMVYLTYATAQPDETDNQDWVHAAAAVELLHLALLIHDDIIDRDTVRYGVKNVSGQQLERYSERLTSSTEARHFADSAAILAGDLLIGAAYELLAQSTHDVTRLSAVTALMNEALFRVAGGELLDTESAFVESPADALLIAQEKTASYSFSSPLRIGAVLGGASEDTLATLNDFGIALGIAYQLQDDLLGMFGDEKELGKSTDGDLREGKKTYMVEQFMAQATEQQKKLFLQAFGNQHATPQVQQAAKTALIDSGARAAVERKIAELEATSRAYTARLDLRDEQRAAFYALIDKCIKRSK